MVRKSEMGNFMEALEAESRRQLDENPDSLMAKDDIEIDGEIPFEAVNFDTFDTVCKLRPFGIGNAKPVFVTRNLIISGIYPMSEGAHIRIELVDDCQNRKRLGSRLRHWRIHKSSQGRRQGGYRIYDE